MTITKKEAAIISLHTGILLGKFEDVHAHLEELLGRPVFTHEIPILLETEKELLYTEFCKIEVEE